MNQINLPKEFFSIEKLKDLEINGTLKDYQDAKNYIFSYFYESVNQTYYHYNVDIDDFEFYSAEDFKKSVLDKLIDKKFISSIKKNARIFTVVTQLGKPRIYSLNNRYYLNVAGAFLHNNVKKFDEYDTKTKNRVQMILDMMRDLSCNGDEEMFKAYMKYYGQIARGMKTEAVIYRKSPEGVGKSTETTFMLDYVFGHKVCLLCNSSDPLTSRFNKILLGKLLVVFEELPSFSDAEWNGVCSKLKSLCTEKRSTYEDKNEKRFEADNISNFQINTNMNALKEVGRRIIVMDFSLKRKGDHTYFANIKKECYNKLIGEAFFSYLLTKISDEDCNVFYSQRDFPETRNKRLAIANSLISPYRFLKEEHVLQKVDIRNMKMKQVYDNYVTYCASKTIKPNGKIDFYRRLEEVGLQCKKTNGYDVYRTTQAELQKIAEREKWICEFDEESINDDEEILDDNDDTLTQENITLKEELKKQQQTINDLLAQLQKLKNPKLAEKPKEIRHVIESDDEKDIEDLEAELSSPAKVEVTFKPKLPTKIKIIKTEEEESSFDSEYLMSKLKNLLD